VSTKQKVLIGGLVAVIVLGGASWAAVESTSSSSRPEAGRHGPRRIGAAVDGRGRLRGGALGGLRFGCRLAHADGALVIRGDTRDVRFDHGTVKSVEAGSVTIGEVDGTTVTIPVDAATRVRRGRQPTTLADLQIGDVLFAVRVDGGAAKLVRASDGDPCQGVPQPEPSASA
jgi:hypothetical protein